MTTTYHMVRRLKRWRGRRFVVRADYYVMVMHACRAGEVTRRRELLALTGKDATLARNFTGHLGTLHGLNFRSLPA